MTDRFLLRGLLSVLIVVGLAWIGAGLFGDPAYLANQEAGERLAAGQTRVALIQYRTLQRERPDLRELEVNAGNAAFLSGDNNRALLDQTAATRAEDPVIRSAAFYSRGIVLFALGRLQDARASWVDSLRADPARRDAKYNIEVVDLLQEALDAAGQPQPGQQPGNQPGQGGPPQPGNQPGQPGQSGPPQPGPSGNPGTGPVPSGAPGGPNASGPPSIGQALIQFRRSLSIEDAMRALDALEAQQRGLQGLLEGNVQQRTPQGAPLY